VVSLVVVPPVMIDSRLGLLAGGESARHAFRAKGTWAGVQVLPDTGAVASSMRFLFLFSSAIILAAPFSAASLAFLVSCVKLLANTPKLDLLATAIAPRINPNEIIKA
jgi:hypothetical protein